MSTQPSAEAFAAPLFLGYFFNWVLFGILSSQVYSYNATFRKKDRSVLRSVVAVVYCLEFSHTVILMATGYNVFVKRFGDVSALMGWTSGWVALPLIGSIVQGTSQSLYAFRIRALRQANVIPAIILVLVVVQFAGMLGLSVHLAGMTPADKYPNKRTHIFSGLWAGSAVICDILIACTMILSLRRRDSIVPATLDIVSKLVQTVVWTGSFTAILATLTLVFLVIPSMGPYYLTTSAIISKAYSCSMLVLLNSRAQWRDNFQRSQQPDEGMDIIHFATLAAAGDKSTLQGETTFSSTSFPAQV